MERDQKCVRNGQRKTYSLRWGFLSILLLCWVLPIVLFLASMLFVITENANRNTGDAFAYSFETYALKSQGRLLEALASSRTVSYDGIVRAAFGRYLQDGNYVRLYAEVTGYLGGQLRRNTGILDAWLFFVDEPDRVLAASDRRRTGQAQRLTAFRAGALGQVAEVSAGLGTDFCFLPEPEMGGLLLVRNLVDRDYTPFAVLVLNLDASHVFSVPEGQMWTDETVYIDGERIRGEGEAPASSKALVNGELRLDSRLYNYTISKRQDIEGHAAVYTARLSDLPFRSMFSPYYYIALFIVLMTALLTFVFLRFFHRNITAPVQDLAEASARISGGGLGWQMPAEYRGAEFNDLATAMNGMSSQLKEMFEQSIKEQLALQDARIGALQSQINPHFLNNTLEIVAWEARMAGTDRVTAMLEALSTMLDAAMGRDGNTLVQLDEELRYLDSYLYIVSVRLGERLTVEKDIDGTLLGLRVPRLIMQPLVENAVEHGISLLPHGKLTLRAFRDGDAACLDVVNDFDGDIDAELTRIRVQTGAQTGGGPTPGGHIGVG
ncbi:MAG: histidine kinase, partial [Clostridiales Family XIII bacterium]|nr:histidine kinase [Clostridiales Family XIII bacterium]